MTAIEEKVDQYNTLVAECNTLLAIAGRQAHRGAANPDVDA